MKKIKNSFIALSALLVLFGLSGCPSGVEEEEISGSRSINIAPIAQQTEVWCWAAVSEMVLRYYGLPNLNPVGNYQCGIVAAYYGPASTCWQNCFTCVSAVGGMSEMYKITTQYGLVASSLGVPSKNLRASLLFRSLSLKEVKNEIDGGRPIIAGVSFQGIALPNISQHVTAIVGYDANGPTPTLLVNDPFPFAMLAQPNPYLQAGGVQVIPGQYKIPYSTFVFTMQWANTVSGIQ